MASAPIGVGCGWLEGKTSTARANVGRKTGSFLAGFGGQKTKKNTFFKKRTGEVIDNKGLATKNKPERTGKRSGEVVENTFLWKKRT